jgi:hypothetical protein
VRVADVAHHERRGLPHAQCHIPLTAAQLQHATDAGTNDVTLNMSKGNYFSLRVLAPTFDPSSAHFRPLFITLGGTR